MSEEQQETNSVSREELTKGDLVADRYEIIRPLGKGGMGVVYLARDLILEDEIVAIKILHREFTYDERHTSRFLREVQLMRRVNNPNVIRTFDVGADNQIVYFTMEYIEARPLDYFIDETHFPAERIVPFIMQICNGLDAIHEAGIIHRDLKPSNILVLDDGSIRIMDFGVARPQNSELTAHNEIVGSATYVAPEIWLGKEPTSSIDLYSLGIILYELTTGDVPFDADSPAALMRLHLDRIPFQPKEINRDVPSWLNRLIVRLLSKSPKDRPANAAEVLDYVDQYTSRGFFLSTAAGADNTIKPCVTNGFLDSLENYSAYLVGQTTTCPSLPEQEKSTIKKNSIFNLGIREKLRNLITTTRPKLRGWYRTLSQCVVFTFSTTLFITAMAWLGYEISNLHTLSESEVSLSFLILAGLPKAVAGALILSLPVVILSSLSRSMIQVVKATSICITYNLLVGAILTLKYLEPVIRKGQASAENLLTAATAASQQLVHLITLSPVTIDYKSFSASGAFYLFSGPCVPIWNNLIILTCVATYLLIIFSTMKSLKKSSSALIGSLIAVFATIYSLATFYLSSSYAPDSLLKIYGFSIPEPALNHIVGAWIVLTIMAVGILLSSEEKRAASR